MLPQSYKIKIPGLPPSTTITISSTEPIMEDIYSMRREEIHLHLKLYELNAGDEASPPTYLHRLKGKHISESIRYLIITSQARNTE